MQLAVGKYDVSLRQLYKREKKFAVLKLLVLKLSMQGKDVTINHFTLEWELYENT